MNHVAHIYFIGRGWGGGIRTHAWRSQSPLPYRLATPHYMGYLCNRVIIKKWGGISDSNRWPPVPQTGALTNWTNPTIYVKAPRCCYGKSSEENVYSVISTRMVRWEGLEPPTLCLEGRCSIQLSYQRICGAGDGNRTHTTSLEGWDSTIELHPRATDIIITNVRRIVKYFLKNN